MRPLTRLGLKLLLHLGEQRVYTTPYYPCTRLSQFQGSKVVELGKGSLAKAPPSSSSLPEETQQ